MNELTKMPVLQPSNFAELVRFAEMAAGSDLMPKDYKGRPGNVMIAVQMGSEVGLSPMQAIQSIAVINGRPALFGDALIGLVRAHPKFENIKEWIEGTGDGRTAFCMIKRAGNDAATSRFSVADAKTANLWGKSGPWTQYPDRMLQSRARAFACRDVFPDALKGLQSAEEARDIPAHVGPTIDAKAEPVTAAPPPPVAEPPRARKQTISAFLDALALELAACEGEAEWHAIDTRADVMAAKEKLTNGAKERLDELLANSLDRVTKVSTGEMEV